MKRLFLLFIATAAALTSLLAQAQDVTPRLQSFEFLGCSGDTDYRLTSPKIWRMTKDKKVTFLIHHVAACGLSGRTPTVSSVDGVLNLNYDLFSPSGAAVMCDCEYWAKFSFGPDASGIRKMTFGGAESSLLGDWPGP
jgi:hypothetical protein